MVRGNKRVNKFAEDVGDDFCYFRWMKENVKLGVRRAVANNWEYLFTFFCLQWLDHFFIFQILNIYSIWKLT